MTTDPLEHVREGLVVRPGDTLIIRLDRLTSMAEFDELREHIRSQLDPDIKCMIVEAPGGQIAVARSI
jgi:hypothetical protein